MRGVQLLFITEKGRTDSSERTKNRYYEVWVPVEMKE